MHETTISKNIIRKKPILDRDPQFYKKVPLPSWIELSLIDVCNRSCSFCPKSDESIAPNTYQKMERVLIRKLCSDLKNFYPRDIALISLPEASVCLIFNQIKENSRISVNIIF